MDVLRGEVWDGDIKMGVIGIQIVIPAMSLNEITKNMALLATKGILYKMEKKGGRFTVVTY